MNQRTPVTPWEVTKAAACLAVMLVALAVLIIPALLIVDFEEPEVPGYKFRY